MKNLLPARIEAEFPGRLLIGPDDLARCLDDRDGGLCWGVIGVEGFDAARPRTPATCDLEHLPGWFARGVRVFQPVYTASSVLGGSSAPGDDRGLTDLGLAFLQALADLEGAAARPVFDLAHLNPKSAAEALDWFEADPVRPARVIPVYSHGALVHDGYSRPRGRSPLGDASARLRAPRGRRGGSASGRRSTPRPTRSGRQGIEAAATGPLPSRVARGSRGSPSAPISSGSTGHSPASAT